MEPAAITHRAPNRSLSPPARGAKGRAAITYIPMTAAICAFDRGMSFTISLKSGGRQLAAKMPKPVTKNRMTRTVTGWTCPLLVHGPSPSARGECSILFTIKKLRGPSIFRMCNGRDRGGRASVFGPRHCQGGRISVWCSRTRGSLSPVLGRFVAVVAYAALGRERCDRCGIGRDSAAWASVHYVLVTSVQTIRHCLCRGSSLWHPAHWIPAAPWRSASNTLISAAYVKCGTVKADTTNTSKDRDATQTVILISKAPFF